MVYLVRYCPTCYRIVQEETLMETNSMNLIITVKATDKHGHVIHEHSKEIENFSERLDLFSLIKGWVFEVTLKLKSQLK